MRSAISDIASALMTADWKWDKTEQDTMANLRLDILIAINGLWAIKTYISNKYKKKKSSYL